jgi:Asp-tRNA(Asn)/Glu-tRNA(Gln) amidotransferase A subunit family amidase
MATPDLAWIPATELAGLIRAKKVSPVEVVDAVLARIERLNPTLNCFVAVTAEEARDAALSAEVAVMTGEELGPLHGVPVSIKDLLFTRRVPTTGGSRLFADHVPEEDAVSVERLKGVGAIIIGKTTTPEFGHKAVTESPLFGITRNPWNAALTPGGSSGGAGAAVAAGLGPLAVGTDGGGSIRIPASFCGIYGLKPSFGRVPQNPGFPGWETLSHTGPMTRTVRDAALMLDAIAGPDDRDRHSLPGSAPSFWPPATAASRGSALPGRPIWATRGSTRRWPTCARRRPSASRASAGTWRWYRPTGRIRRRPSASRSAPRRGARGAIGSRPTASRWTVRSGPCCASAPRSPRRSIFARCAAAPSSGRRCSGSWRASTS